MEDGKGKKFHAIHNRKGKASYFMDKDRRFVYNEKGDPAAAIVKGAVLALDGKHLGWYGDGWLRDKEGKCVGFSEPTGKGGPNPPKAKRPTPPARKQDPPDPPEPGELPEHPPRRPLWSDLSDKEFFGD